MLAKVELRKKCEFGVRSCSSPGVGGHGGSGTSPAMETPSPKDGTVGRVLNQPFARSVFSVTPSGSDEAAISSSVSRRAG
jgi:hypothetical protein